MSKIKLDTIKPWITNKITEMLNGMEDDVVVDYVFNQLEADKVMIQPFFISVKDCKLFWPAFNVSQSTK